MRARTGRRDWPGDGGPTTNCTRSTTTATAAPTWARSATSRRASPPSCGPTPRRAAYPDSPDEDAQKAWLSARLHRSLPYAHELRPRRAHGLEALRHRPAGRRRRSGRSPRQAAQSLSTRLALRAWWSRSRLVRARRRHRPARRLRQSPARRVLRRRHPAGRRREGDPALELPRGTVRGTGLAGLSRPPADALRSRHGRIPGRRRRADCSWRRRAQRHRDAGAPRPRAAHRRRLGRRAARACAPPSSGRARNSNDLYWEWSGWSVQAGAAIEF